MKLKILSFTLIVVFLFSFLSLSLFADSDDLFYQNSFIATSPGYNYDDSTFYTLKLTYLSPDIVYLYDLIESGAYLYFNDILVTDFTYNYSTGTYGGLNLHIYFGSEFGHVVFNFGSYTTFSLITLQGDSSVRPLLIDDFCNFFNLDRSYFNTNGSNLQANLLELSIPFSVVLPSQPSALDLIFSNLSFFSSSMFGLWQNFVDFIMIKSNVIVLFGLLAWLFIYGVGFVRRFITGV